MAKEVSDWFTEIKNGKKWRYQASGLEDAEWTDYIDFYRGTWAQEADMPKLIASNRVFPYVRSTIPSIYLKNPSVYVVDGKVIGQFNDREVLQGHIEYLLKILELKKAMKRMVFDTFIFGIGFIKIGFGSEYTPGQNSILDKNEERLEYHSAIHDKLPWVTNVDPRDIVFPYGTKTAQESRWVAQRILRNYEDAIKDPNLKHRDDIKSHPYLTRRYKGALRNEEIIDNNGDLNMAVMWEITDKKDNSITILSEGGDKVHYKEIGLKTDSGFPLHNVVFDQDPENLWGISAIGIIKPQQLELNRVKTMLHVHWARECTKFLFSNGSIEPGEKGDQQIAAINDATIPMAGIRVIDADKIKVLTANTPPDLLAAVREIDNDIRFQIGFNRLTTGEATTGRHTAFEIDAMKEAINIRNNERRDLVVDVFEAIVHDLFRLSFEYMDEKTVKDINNGLMWNARTNEREYYLEINAEEAVPVTSQTKRADAITLFDRLSRSPLANPAAVLANLLQSYDLKLENYIDPELANVLQQAILARQQGQGAENA